MTSSPQSTIAAFLGFIIIGLTSIGECATTYTGLLNLPQTEPGFGSIQFTQTGFSVTGKVRYNDQAHRFRGVIQSGIVQITLPEVVGQSPDPIVQLTLNADELNQILTASAVTKTGKIIAISFNEMSTTKGRAVKNGIIGSERTRDFGLYTFVMDRESTESQVALKGVGRLHVAKSGTTSVVGWLPDGRKFSQSRRITTSRQIPIAIATTKDGTGYLLGYLEVKLTSEGQNLSPNELSGSLIWNKASGIDPLPMVDRAELAVTGGDYRAGNSFFHSRPSDLRQLSISDSNTDVIASGTMERRSSTIVGLQTSVGNLSLTLDAGTGLLGGNIRFSDGEKSRIYGVLIQNPLEFIDGFYFENNDLRFIRIEESR